MELIKGYSLISEDGAEIRVTETQTRESIIVSIFKGGIMIEASLNNDMFHSLFDLKYKLEIHRPVPPVASPAEKEDVA